MHLILNSSTGTLVTVAISTTPLADGGFNRERVCLQVKPAPRKEYSFVVLPFCQDFSWPLITCMALPNQTVSGLTLSQRHKRLCCFVLDIMDYFLAGNDQPQTNLPNGQACG